ncbi:hypothetical protein [Kitasatospora sp. NPDC059599]
MAQVLRPCSGPPPPPALPASAETHAERWSDHAPVTAAYDLEA